MAEPTTTGTGLADRCQALAAKARHDQEQLYRCPACQDLGWIPTKGTTYGGRKDSPLEQPCTGPTGTGCAYRAWRDEHRPRPRTITPERGRMD